MEISNKIGPRSLIKTLFTSLRLKIKNFGNKVLNHINSFDRRASDFTRRTDNSIMVFKFQKKNFSQII